MLRFGASAFTRLALDSTDPDMQKLMKLADDAAFVTSGPTVNHRGGGKSASPFFPSHFPSNYFRSLFTISFRISSPKRESRKTDYLLQFSDFSNYLGFLTAAP